MEKPGAGIARFIIAALLGAAACLAVPGVAWSATRHPVHHVVIENIQFTPGSMVVSVGDTVIWTNNDLVPHTVTAKNGSFDSKTINPGKSWKYRVRKAGTLDYFCRFHPTMKGQLQVLAKH